LSLTSFPTVFEDPLTWWSITPFYNRASIATVICSSPLLLMSTTLWQLTPLVNIVLGMCLNLWSPKFIAPSQQLQNLSRLSLWTPFTTEIRFYSEIQGLQKSRTPARGCLCWVIFN
jgi:hypothetical protein